MVLTYSGGSASGSGAGLRPASTLATICGAGRHVTHAAVHAPLARFCSICAPLTPACGCLGRRACPGGVPPHGACFVPSSHNTTPKAYTSAGNEYPLPASASASKISGALYARVPACDSVAVAKQRAPQADPPRSD